MKEKANQTPSEWGKGATQEGVVLFIVIAFFPFKSFRLVSIYVSPVPFMPFSFPCHFLFISCHAIFSWKSPEIQNHTSFRPNPTLEKYSDQGLNQLGKAAHRSRKNVISSEL